MAIESVESGRNTSRSAAFDFVDDALARVSGQPIIAVISVPAPYAPMSAFLRAVPREHGFVWNNPPFGIDCAGGGVAHLIEVSGPDRFAQLRRPAAAPRSRVAPAPLRAPPGPSGLPAGAESPKSPCRHIRPVPCNARVSPSRTLF